MHSTKKVPVEIRDRTGNFRLLCPSITKAAKFLRVCPTTVINRLLDGYPIVKDDCRGLYVDIVKE